MTAPKLQQGLIGDDPAAVTLAAALHRCGHPLLAATPREAGAADTLDALAPGLTWADAEDVAATSDLVWLAANADQLGPLADRLAASGVVRPGLLVAHATPGATLAPLAAATRAGATVLAVVPLVPTDATSLGVKALAGAPTAVSAPGAFIAVAQALAVDAGCEAIAVSDTALPLLAATCRLAGDAVACSLDAAMRLAAHAGVADPVAIVAPIARAHAERAYRGESTFTSTLASVRSAQTAVLDRIRLSSLDADDPDPAVSDLSDVAAWLEAVEAHLSQRAR